MVPPARFQRATSRLGGERSMQLSYGSTRVGIVQRQLSIVSCQLLVVSGSFDPPVPLFATDN